MADIDYPADLRAFLIGRGKKQTAKIRTTQPLSGPAYIEKLSTDAPVIYEVSFKFGLGCFNEALLFRAWVEYKGIDRGVPFNIPLNHEGFNEGNQTQEVQVLPSSGYDILSNVHQGQGIYEYKAILRCRKEVTGLEDYYPIIVDGGKDLLENMGNLDIAMNQVSPRA